MRSLSILRLLPHEKEARSFLDHITDVDGLFQAKYDSAELKSALVEVFGGRTLSQATCRLVIPSVNLESGQPVVFKTPHLPDAIENAEYLAVDAALATAAAPTYFPHASNDYGTFGDGGLWANNPSIVGYVEAVRILRDCRMGSTDEIEMLSIGTGRPRIFVLPTSGSKPGVAWWGPRLLDFTGACQSQAAHRHAKFLMGSRYSRINFDVPDESWSMDYVPAVETLVHLGRAAAACELKRLKPTFFTREAEAFIHA